MSGFRDASGLDAIEAFYWRDAGGLHTAAAIRMRDGANVLQDVFGGGSFTVTATPSNADGYGNSKGAIFVSTPTVSASAPGRPGPLTYAWTTQDGLLVPLAPSSQTTAFRTVSTVGPGDSVTDIARCTVTDANGATGESNYVYLSAGNFGN